MHFLRPFAAMSPSGNRHRKARCVPSLVQNICNEALHAGGFPPIFLSFVEPGHTLAEQFVDDKRVGLMSFTGSFCWRATGWRPCRCAWGGVCWNSVVTMPSSSTRPPTCRWLFPVLFSARCAPRQRCTSTRRLFVHDSILQQVTDSLVSAYEQVRVGDPLEATR